MNETIMNVYVAWTQLFTQVKQEKYLSISTCTEIMRWIVADPEICHGKPIFKGTRILVSDVLELVAAGESFEEIVEEYPSLNKDMIKEALEYSARILRGEHYVRFEVPVG